MSVLTLESKEKRLLRDIEALHRKLERLSKSKLKSAPANYIKAQKDRAKKTFRFRNNSAKTSQGTKA